MIQILPYTKLNGEYTIDDNTLIALYYKMLGDKTFEIVFYDGEIRTSEDFLRLLKSKENFPAFVIEDNKIKAFAWLNDLKDNHAIAHFCVFKESWGNGVRDFGIEMLKYWFSFPKEDGAPLFDIILGVTPSGYKVVLKFIKDIGFHIVGDVPQVIWDAYKKRHTSATLSYCEREQWHQVSVV